MITFFVILSACCTVCKYKGFEFKGKTFLLGRPFDPSLKGITATISEDFFFKLI